MGAPWSLTSTISRLYPRKHAGCSTPFTSLLWPTCRKLTPSTQNAAIPPTKTNSTPFIKPPLPTMEGRMNVSNPITFLPLIHTIPNSARDSERISTDSLIIPNRIRIQSLYLLAPPTNEHDASRGQEAETETREQRKHMD